MFNSARLKLTAWYLLVIMLVSVTFSMMIFQMQVAEWSRFERRFHFVFAQEAAERLTVFLVVINGGILVVSGSLGYFLAGKTLKPIKEMVEEQNRFIADASHELRTPLTALKSALEVNLRDKKLLKDCLEQVNKLQSLTESLLQLSNNSLKLEKVNFSEIVKTAIAEIEPKAKQKGIVVKKAFEEAFVLGDKYALTDLVVILLDNAIKYSPKKTVVTVGLQENILTVSDQGIGIAEKDLPHIFNRFYRADPARTGGYGLGLSIAKKIVEAHQGTIEIASEVNKGTTVTVRLKEVNI